MLIAILTIVYIVGILALCTLHKADYICLSYDEMNRGLFVALWPIAVPIWFVVVACDMLTDNIAARLRNKNG